METKLIYFVNVMSVSLASFNCFRKKLPVVRVLGVSAEVFPSQIGVAGVSSVAVCWNLILLPLVGYEGYADPWMMVF